MQRWGTNCANSPLKGRMSKSNIWINAQTTSHPLKYCFKALLRDLVASQHPENERKRPKPRLQLMNQRYLCGFGSVTDVGTDVAIVAGVGAHDAAKWGSRREGQLLCC
ncbi:hypothetical protein CXB51_002745 [Gossypium anomalum]|uniref:Uncharacterized protein n=1 Tax=Gossypium anomalum TaxID=47600 RepID=A0A8J5Z111_9ROSI|nr:hypothetical protein CXB51_002745 [Gossypium anomalum]